MRSVIDAAAGRGDLLPDLECVGPESSGDSCKLCVLCQSRKSKPERFCQEGATMPPAPPVAMAWLTSTVSSKKNSSRAYAQQDGTKYTHVCSAFAKRQ